MLTGEGKRFTLDNMNTTTKKATEIKAGDKVVERDGAYFAVRAVERQGRWLMFHLDNVAGYMTAPKCAIVSTRAQVRVLAEEAAG